MESSMLQLWVFCILFLISSLGATAVPETDLDEQLLRITTERDGAQAKLKLDYDQERARLKLNKDKALARLKLDKEKDLARLKLQFEKLAKLDSLMPPPKEVMISSRDQREPADPLLKIVTKTETPRAAENKDCSDLDDNRDLEEVAPGQGDVKDLVYVGTKHEDSVESDSEGDKKFRDSAEYRLKELVSKMTGRFGREALFVDNGGRLMKLSKTDLDQSRAHGVTCAEFKRPIIRIKAVRALNSRWINVVGVQPIGDLLKEYDDIRIDAMPKPGKRARYLSFKLPIKDFLRNNGGSGNFLNFHPWSVEDYSRLIFQYSKVNQRYILANLDIRGCKVPRPVQLPGLSHTTHGVSSGPITLLTPRTMKIRNFWYSGGGPGVNFLMMLTQKSTQIMPGPSGSKRPSLGIFYAETLTITLDPEDMKDFYSMLRFSIYCKTLDQHFGYVDVPKKFRVDGILPADWTRLVIFEQQMLKYQR